MDSFHWQQDGADPMNGTSPVLITILLPLNHNDGRDMESERLEHVLSGLLQHAGGLTQHAPSFGYWCNSGGRIFQDRMLPIQVVVPSHQEADIWFVEWLLDTTVRLEQEEIFYLIQSVCLLESRRGAAAVDDVLFLG